MKTCVTHSHACDCREEKFRKLEEENARLKDGYLADENGNEYVAVCVLKEKISELRAERDKAVEALKFYANKKNYALSTLTNPDRNHEATGSFWTDNDYGKRARAALRELGVEESQ